MADSTTDELSAPAVVDRATFQAQLDALRIREKSHTREGDAIAAARRRLPMVEVDGSTPLIGERGTLTLLHAFEGRQQLLAYYFMWYTGKRSEKQCEGCTWVTSQVRELSYIHQRHVTFAVLCQGPYEESVRCNRSTLAEAANARLSTSLSIPTKNDGGCFLRGTRRPGAAG